jgi:phosphoribosyl-ATP pyrophosphohydrolase
MNDASNSLGEVLDRVWRIIEDRRTADPEKSHTARLFARGRKKIAQKFGEEAVEAVIEGACGDGEALVRESADVLYHLMVLWAATHITPDEIAAELARREGISGIDEKKARKG